MKSRIVFLRKIKLKILFIKFMATIQETIKKLDAWAKKQKNLRLVLGEPLADEEISSIPQKIADAHNHFLTVKFDPADFPIPESYHEFLRLYSFARLEYREDEDGEDW